jgi:hypothetical protein
MYSPRDYNSSHSHLRDHEYTRVGSFYNDRPTSVRVGSRQGSHQHARSMSWDPTRRSSDHKRQTDSVHNSSVASKPLGRDGRIVKSDSSIDSAEGNSAEKQHEDKIPSSGTDNATAGNTSMSVSSTKDKEDEQSSCKMKELSSVPVLPDFLPLEVDDTCVKYNLVPEEKKTVVKKDGSQVQSQSSAEIQTGSSGKESGGDNSDDIIVLGNRQPSGQDSRQNQIGNGVSQNRKSTVGKPPKSLVSSSSAVQLKQLSPSIVQKVLKQTQSGKTDGFGHKPDVTSICLSSPNNPTHTSGSEKSSETSDIRSQKQDTPSSVQQDLVEKRERLREACKRIDKEAVNIREKKQAREAARWLDQQVVRTEQWDQSQQQDRVVISDKEAAEVALLSNPSKTTERQTQANDNISDGGGVPPAMADAMIQLCGLPDVAQKSANRPQCKYVLEDGKQCGVITFSQYCPHHKQLVQSQTGGQPDPLNKAMEGDNVKVSNQYSDTCSSLTQNQTHDKQHSSSLVWDDSQPRDSKRSNSSVTDSRPKDSSRSINHTDRQSDSERGCSSASGQVMQQRKKREGDTISNTNPQKKARMSTNGIKSKGQHSPSGSALGQAHKQGKKRRRTRWRQNRDRKRAAMETKKLEKELSELRDKKAKNMTEVNELHVRLDKLYEDMRLNLRQESQIISRLMQISGQQNMNTSATFQEETGSGVQSQQSRSHNSSHSSLTIVRSAMPLGPSCLTWGSNDCSQPPTPTNNVSNVPASRRIVTVGSGATSRQSLTIPVARKSCAPRVTTSTDVMKSVMPQPSLSNSAGSSRRQSDQCPISASTQASTRTNAQATVDSTKKTVSQSVASVIHTPTPISGKKLSSDQFQPAVTSTPATSSDGKQSSPQLSVSSSSKKQPSDQPLPPPTSKLAPSSGKKHSSDKSSQAQAASINQKASMLSARSTGEDLTIETGTVAKQDGNSKATVAVPSTKRTQSSSLGPRILIKPDPDGPSETLPLVQVPTGEVTPGPFYGHTKCISSLKFGGGLLFSCSTDKSCCIFNTKTHTLVRRLTEHSAPVTSVQLAFVDGKYRLFTGSRDQTVRSFDLQKPANKSCTHNFRFSSQVTALHSDWDFLFVGLESGNVCCLDMKVSVYTMHVL